MGGGSRRWCFTNFKLDFDYKAFMEKYKATYVMYGTEVCPDTKNIHHQGWCYFKDAKSSYKSVGKAFGQCHVEMCNGTMEQNDKYCKKDGDITELGTKPAQGERTDLNVLKARIIAGETADQLMMEDAYNEHVFGRTLARIEAVVNSTRHREWRTTCEWCWGATGTGKTYSWKSKWNPEFMWIYKTNDRGWCEGYCGQEIVIINELRRGDIAYKDLLDMCDDQPHYLPQRGKAPVPFMAKHIYITTCMHPKEMFHDLEYRDSIDQLLDRIEVRHFQGPNRRKFHKNIFLADVLKDAICQKADCCPEESGSQACSSEEH